MREEIVPAPCPKVTVNLVGQVVAFDLRRATGKVTRETGQVASQEWLGVTTRGAIPEYEVVVVGKTGISVKARVVEDHVQTVNPKTNPTK
jgi:hypothetical protein